MYSFCSSTTCYRGFPQTSLSESALQDTESSELSKTVQTSKSIYDQPSSDTSDFMKYLARRVQLKTGFPTVHREFINQSQSESSLHTKDSSREIKPVRASKSSYDEPSNLSRAAMRWIATRELLKTGFPETYIIKVQQSRSESSLRHKDSSRFFKTVQASKSIHDAPSTDSQKFIKRRNKRAVAKAEPSKRPVEIKESRPVSSLCATDDRKGKLDITLSEKTKKRDRPVTPLSDEQLDLKRPKLETPTNEELIKQEIPCAPFVNACLKRELAHDKNTHHNLREIERLNSAPSTSRLQSLIQPDVIRSSRPAWFENQFAEDDEDLDAEVAMIMDKGEPQTVCPDREMLECSGVPTLLHERTNEGSSPISIPCVPFVNACLKRELAHDKNTHHNLREIERLNAVPSTSRLQSLIQPDISTSSRPAWFENQFAEDDEDLDAEVAMIMDKGEPQTVCPDRGMLEDSGVPTLLQERTNEGSSPISIPCAPFVNACLKRELAQDRNTHHNLREIERLNAAPSTSRLQSLIQPDIITSSRPAWFENQFAEDDEDLDAEVAMIMDKGEPSTVCPDKGLLGCGGVPPILHERTIEGFQDKPLLYCTDGYYEQCSSPISIRCEPSQDAIKIVSKRSSLHGNEKFGGPEKKGKYMYNQKIACQFGRIHLVNKRDDMMINRILNCYF